jgi:hypothetical protein
MVKLGDTVEIAQITSKPMLNGSTGTVVASCESCLEHATLTLAKLPPITLRFRMLQVISN